MKKAENKEYREILKERLKDKEKKRRNKKEKLKGRKRNKKKKKEVIEKSESWKQKMATGSKRHFCSIWSFQAQRVEKIKTW